MGTGARAGKNPLRRAPPRAAKVTRQRASGRATRQASACINYALSDSESDGESEDELLPDDDPVPTLASTSRRRTRSSGLFAAAPAPKRQRQPHKSMRGDEDELAYLSPWSGEDGADQPGAAAKAARERQKPVATARTLRRTSTTGEEPEAGLVTLPWHTLPYLILVSILDYASAPLNDDISVRWLVAAARTCRAFAEPSVTVLYRSPPLTTAGKAYCLAALLARSPSTTLFNYRQKVESLRVDVGWLQLRPMDVESLISNCPRLTELDICHYKDMSPYRQLDDNVRWKYPASLFEKLGVSQAGAAQDGDSPAIRLKSWRWSQRMMDRPFAEIRALHLSPPFSSLQKITFVNFQRPSLMAKDAEDPEVVANDRHYAEVFGGVLNALQDLRHLVIESSTAANELLLPMLPKALRHLELINCWDVTAEHFADYLRSRGRELRSLALHHNQSLSLAFLPALRSSCPNLLALRMNLTYYSHHEFYNDSDPMYDSLLLAGQVPMWPSSLQVIELEHLRHWGADAAEVFFQSLAGSALQLPMLRHLAIKAMLDIPWRQRSEMRDKWVARLKTIFKRQAQDPKPVHTLQSTGLEHKHKPTAPLNKIRVRRDSAEASRRSGRIAALVPGPPSRSSSAARVSRRPGPGHIRVSYREPDSDDEMDDEDELAAEDSADDEREEGATSPSSANEQFIQGLCDVVDIRFDNQKPMETQYGMEDFLDSDHANSDDEWMGDDDGAEGTEYAW